MRQNWFAGTLGAAMLVLGTAWTQTGAAYAVSFTPPGNGAPRSSTGGASRSSVFTPPPGSASPRDATGGASRGGFFTPPPESAAPSNGTGGASRGGFFTPPPESATPSNGTGGASRGDFFTPPPDNAAPQNGTGGASRGSFDDSGEVVGGADGATRSLRSNAYGATYSSAGLDVPTMLAVTPDSFYGTTLQARPTILVYVPAANAKEAIFSIKDEAKNLVYQMPVAVPEGGGMMAVELPAAAPELAVDANYQWYVAMKLDGELSPASPFVDGWVKRIEPSAELSVALNGGDALSDVEALGASGIWYDTAAQLAELTVAQQDDAVAGHWYELLESVGLAEIAAAPIAM